MSVLDYSAFQVGGSVFPLATTSENSLLEDADPVVFFSLDFYTAMLNRYLGARFLSALSAAGVKTSGGAITAAVMQAVGYDPAAYLGTTQFQFPLLGVYRKSVVAEWKEFGYERDASGMGVTYVLPPLTASQAQQILPILGAVWKVLRAKTTQGWDPNYIPPRGTSPMPGPWHLPYAHAEEMALTKASYGSMPGDGNLFFPTMLAEGTFYERDNVPPKSASNVATFAGLDATIANLSDDGVTSCAQPARVVGDVDVTATTLYGVGGSLDGTTLTLNVDGAGSVSLTLSGAGNAASNPSLLSAIANTWPALSTVASSGEYGYLVLVAPTSIQVVSSMAASYLGLTVGTTTSIAGLAPVAQTSTRVAPTVTSVSPSSGPIAGGTAVNVTGTGFDTTYPGGVLFGANAAKSVVVVSSTTITCVTPSVSGNGSVSVAVMNGDGQSGELATAFTYT